MSTNNAPTLPPTPSAPQPKLRPWVWRGVVFLIGLVPITGTIHIEESPWTFTVATGHAISYLLMADSVVTGCVDLLAKSEQARNRSQKFFQWIAIGLLLALILALVLPILWSK